jgi:transposase
MSKPERRTYSRDFKMEAVGLVANQGYTYRQAAESLGVHETLIRSWKKRGSTPKGLRASLARGG